MFQLKLNLLCYMIKYVLYWQQCGYCAIEFLFHLNIKLCKTYDYCTFYTVCRLCITLLKKCNYSIGNILVERLYNNIIIRR